jgi:hypothetical protein
MLGAVLVGTAMVAPAVAQEGGAASGVASGFAQIDGTRLTPATLSYDATVQMGDRTRNLAATQTVTATTIGGQATWTIVNRIDTPQGTRTDSLVVDRTSLLPRSRHRSGGAALAITYTDTAASGAIDVSGTVGSGDRARSIRTRLERPTLAGGVHDVLALGAMPLEPGFETALRVFAPQDQATKRATFAVTGTETVETPAGTFETYVVDLNVGDGYVTGTVHLRKTAPHYYVKWRTTVSAGPGPRTITQTLSSITESPAPGAK